MLRLIQDIGALNHVAYPVDNPEPKLLNHPCISMLFRNGIRCFKPTLNIETQKALTIAIMIRAF